MDEFRLGAYENVKLYRDKALAWQAHSLLTFERRNQVLLYSCRLRFIPEKFKSRWSGPFTMVLVFSLGAIEIKDEKTRAQFKINGQWLKHYHGGARLTSSFLLTLDWKKMSQINDYKQVLSRWQPIKKKTGKEKEQEKIIDNLLLSFRVKWNRTKTACSPRKRTNSWTNSKATSE